MITSGQKFVDVYEVVAVLILQGIKCVIYLQSRKAWYILSHGRHRR